MVMKNRILLTVIIASLFTIQGFGQDKYELLYQGIEWMKSNEFKKADSIFNSILDDHPKFESALNAKSLNDELLKNQGSISVPEDIAIEVKDIVQIKPDTTEVEEKITIKEKATPAPTQKTQVITYPEKAVEEKAIPQPQKEAPTIAKQEEVQEEEMVISNESRAAFRNSSNTTMDADSIVTRSSRKFAYVEHFDTIALDTLLPILKKDTLDPNDEVGAQQMEEEFAIIMDRLQSKFSPELLKNYPVFGLAYEKYLEEDYARALVYFSFAIQKNQYAAPCHLFRGHIFLLLRNMEEASLEFEQSKKLDASLFSILND